MPFATADDAVVKAFQTIGNEWALLSAGNEQRFNAMTISWGSLGFIWQRPIVTVLVRPQRYTHEFMDRFPNFSVSFFARQHHEALNILGTESGRDSDKIARSGLTPYFAEGAPVFHEAYLTVIARKLYRGKLEGAGFLDSSIDEQFYPHKDHHTVYHAEIVKTIGKL